MEVSVGGLPKPVIQKGGLWGQEAGVGDSHSQVHSWRRGLLVRLRVSLKGPGNEGISVEEAKELRPGCWELSTWMVTVTGSGQRKNLGLEPKPLISGRKQLGGLVRDRWPGWPGLRRHGAWSEEAQGDLALVPLFPASVRDERSKSVACTAEKCCPLGPAWFQ